MFWPECTHEFHIKIIYLSNELINYITNTAFFSHFCTIAQQKSYRYRHRVRQTLASTWFIPELKRSSSRSYFLSVFMRPIYDIWFGDPLNTKSFYWRAGIKPGLSRQLLKAMILTMITIRFFESRNKL